MLRKVTDTGASIYNSVTSRVTDTVSSFFHNADAVNQVPHELTRFNSASQLSDIASALEKLEDKKERLTKIVEEKGENSEESATCEVISQVIELARQKINMFNNTKIKPSILENIKEMQGLTKELKSIIAVTPEDEEVLDSMATDKPLMKNRVLSIALMSLAVIPTFILGPGVLATVLGVGGLAVAKPTNDYLIETKVINWDTESKDLMTKYIDSVEKADDSLIKCIEDNKDEKHIKMRK